MAFFGLRYDLRCPSFGKASSEELCATALEQCAWADRLGFATVSLSEHHGSPDGYLPSPLVFGAAIAARTERMRLLLAALVVPLHDPLRLAEDLAVLDVLSRGRIIPVLAGGYVESEFRAFGRRLSQRASVMEEIVPFLERAWTGEPFAFRGSTVRVTPRPVQQPRPPIFMGGASPAAARRAARLADHFIPSTPELFEEFRRERHALGRPDPGPLPPTLGNFVHVAEDPDAAWQRIAPFALHETNAYADWAEPGGVASPYDRVTDADSLRDSGRYRVLTPEEVVSGLRGLGPLATLILHPLMGGMDPELSWESLRLVETRVLPALQDPS